MLVDWEKIERRSNYNSSQIFRLKCQYRSFARQDTLYPWHKLCQSTKSINSQNEQFHPLAEAASGFNRTATDRLATQRGYGPIEQKF